MGDTHPESASDDLQDVGDSNVSVVTEDVPQEGTHPDLKEQLFQHLVALRRKVASEEKLPPYIIFHDSTLREMCRLLPSDLQSLKGIQGIGLVKLEKYGMRFIEAIREFLDAHDIKGAA